MPIRSSNWAELIVPGLSEAFSLGYGRRPSMVSTLYDIRPSSRKDEQHLGAGVIGTDAWSQFEKSGRVNYSEFDRGYKWTTTHAEFATGLMIQRKLVDDNQFGDILDRSRQLGDSAFRFRESAAVALFNNAFTASGTDAYGFAIQAPDGVALCSASHPRSPDSAGTTDSNTSNITLTAANLATARQNHMTAVDDKGDILNVTPDELLVPPELEDTALQLVRSQLDPVSANNAINPQAGRFTVRVWHYLTSATNWFLIDSGLRSQSLIWYERVPLEYSPEDFDTDTQTFKMVAYNRFSRGSKDYRWIYGCGA